MGWVQEAYENLTAVGVGPHVGTVLNVSDNFGFIECCKTYQVFKQDVFLPPDEINSRENYEGIRVPSVNVQFMLTLSDNGDPQATKVKVISHKDFKSIQLKDAGNEDDQNQKPKCCAAWYRR